MKILRGLLFVGGVLTIVSQAKADSYVSGVICRPVAGSANCVDYDVFGVRNICATTATVECPLTTDDDVALTVGALAVTMYDRNTSSNVSCDFVASDPDGTVIYSTTLASSAGGPGSGVQQKNVSVRATAS